MSDNNQNHIQEENKEVNFLSKDAILAAEDIEKVVVEVPEWGGSVYIFTMTGTERDQFEASIVTKNGNDVSTNMENFRGKLCSICMRNINGRRLFPNEEDVALLSKKSSLALDRVYEVAQKINGITAKDQEELTKN